MTVKPGGGGDFSLLPSVYPKPLRSHVDAVGRFVRVGEELADSTWLSRRQRLERIDSLRARLSGHPVDVAWSGDARDAVDDLRASLDRFRAPAEPLDQVLAALRDLVAGADLHSWGDLRAHCRKAASPVGLHLLSVAGENTKECKSALDQMCAALWILKRMRDCRNPAKPIHAFGIPKQFVDDAAISVVHLRAPTAKGQTRAVLDRLLDGVDHLLSEAALLPWHFKTRGPRLHSAIALCRARKLARRLRHQDPLSERVELEPGERHRCYGSAWLRWLLGWR